MDDIVLRCANRNLKESRNREFIKEEVIRPTYGIHYTKHFQRMMTTLIGIIMYEKLEKLLDQIKFQKMKSELGNLTQKRNEEAHTYIKITRTINAPSVTLRQFKAIHEGLVDIEHKLKLMNHLR
ncbi:MAG: endoribonuclease [Candidatus Cloacimonetes bacterium]|nr:endoribonuclease [Candidatus Cloacimonadota bacterium]